MTAGEEFIPFTKVRLPWGFLSNMSPHPVSYSCRHGEVEARTTEHLFQVLRLPEGHPAVADVLDSRSPMQAKLTAKKYSADMSTVPTSAEDLDNMRTVVRLKAETHREIREAVVTSTGTFVEDVTRRAGKGAALFWGMKQVGPGRWVGENWLGRIWMEVREEMQNAG